MGGCFLPGAAVDENCHCVWCSSESDCDRFQSYLRKGVVSSGLGKYVSQFENRCGHTSEKNAVSESRFMTADRLVAI